MRNKIVKNAAWIVGAKIVQSVLAFIISSLTARYLGPSDFGVIGYAQSIVTFVLPISQLGLTAILVQELIRNPNDEGKILGTAITLSSLSALLCASSVIIFVSLVNYNEAETIIVCTLYSSILLMQSFELIRYWFQAKYLSKFTSVTMLCAYIFVSAYKVVLLVLKKDVYCFAISYTIDYLIISICLHIIYRKVNGQRLTFSKIIAKRLLANGKYYILSGLMTTIFAQTDRIMLKLMIDDAETGYYSAAATCAGLASFFFAAIIDSMRPAIIENKAASNQKYEKSIIQLYSIVIYSAVLYSFIITFLASLIINILYGKDFYPAIIVLQILVWYTTFSYFGGAKDIWILVEEKQKYLVVLNACGAAINVILNILFIPKYGAVGAAIASLTTQFFTNIIMCFLIRELRGNGILFLHSLNPAVLIKSCRGILGTFTKFK